MHSVSKALKYTGKCLMSGKESTIEIVPNSSNEGIVFVDKNSGVTIKATVYSVIDTSHSVTIGNNKFKVSLIEHLMASLALNNVNNAEIFTDGHEMPIGDGSALEFSRMLSSINEESKKTTKQYKLLKPVFFNHKHTNISAIPSENFRITYAVNFPGTNFEKSWYSWDSNKNNISEIISARTFGYTKDLELYQSQGYALGVDINNTVGFNNDGSTTTELRYPDEPVRHKVLDLIGDLFLTGINPLNVNMHVIAIECGHFQHIEFAKLLKEHIEEE